VELAFCFAHARRKFWDVHIATKSPIAAKALQRIAMFYAIDDRIRGLPAAHRAAVRQTDTKPLIEDFKPWLEARLPEVSKKSGLGKAIRYTLSSPAATTCSTSISLRRTPQRLRGERS
jgi:transposase